VIVLVVALVLVLAIEIGLDRAGLREDRRCRDEPRIGSATLRLGWIRFASLAHHRSLAQGVAPGSTRALFGFEDGRPRSPYLDVVQLVAQTEKFSRNLGRKYAPSST
jgi:hypothetical protein